ncbi:amino acid transporter [Xylariomycetidae sp. FL0641]|nr:amino acid transporter [Xylariomycetidae sp. FL0641]
MPKDNLELQVTVPQEAPSSSKKHAQAYDDFTTLQRLGKRPLLERSFGFMSILGFSCSALCSWESILMTSVPTLLVCGPGGLIWALVVNWIGVTSIYTTIAELASVAPTAAGQYHWVAMLAPESAATFLAYLVAWLTTISWQAMSATVGYLIATLLQGIVVLANPSYVPQPWHTVLIIWASTLFAVLMNSITSKTLAKFEGLILVLHLAGFFGVLIPLVYFAPHNDAASVFTTVQNNGGWPKDALAFLVGLPTMASALLGADCAVHMSEEIQSAATVVPRALVYTAFVNGSLALGIIVALLFCVTNLEAAMASAEVLFYPSLQIFYAAVQSRVGACLMAIIVLILSNAASVGIYASASRMLWSFARDRGLPFDRQLVKLSKNSLPVNAIMTTFFITVLLSLIVLGSSVALLALLSLVNAALFTSYTLVCGLLLWRRCCGKFRPYIPGSGVDDHPPGTLVWGPWKLPEPLGVANNIFACLYSIFILFWSFWPQTYQPTPDTANWSPLVFGSLFIFSIVWYFIRARTYFKGPIKEV